MNKKHGLLMLLCCLVPLLIILVLPLLGFQVGALGRFASMGIALICPLMHIGLLAFLFKGKGGSCCSSKQDVSDQRI